MITFSEARQRVRDRVARDWEGAPWPLWVAPWGYQDERAYQVPYGPPESTPLEQQPTDLPLALVDRQDGAVDLVPYLVVADRVDAMEPVPGYEPPAPEPD